jgi:thioredoxin reductase
MRRAERQYDVVIVGGGAAGLSAGVALARARRSVLVVDAGEPRNAPAGHVHNYLAREGTPPGDLLAAGRAEVEGYGGTIVWGTAAAVERQDGPHGLLVVLDDGCAIGARRLLVATGLADRLPDVPGVAERWGTDVLHCPYCHGWEVRDEPIGILGDGPTAVHQALMWRQWSDDVTLFLHRAPQPSADEREELAARDITVVDGEVAGLEIDDDGITGVRLVSGEVVLRRAVVVAPRFDARAGVLASLGIEPEPLMANGHVIGTFVPADASGATAVPGVWVAGNVTDLKAQVVVSAAAGLNTAAMINTDLIAEDTRLAVAERRNAEA